MFILYDIYCGYMWYSDVYSGVYSGYMWYSGVYSGVYSGYMWYSGVYSGYMWYIVDISKLCLSHFTSNNTNFTYYKIIIIWLMYYQ